MLLLFVNVPLIQQVHFAQQLISVLINALFTVQDALVLCVSYMSSILAQYTLT